ncbi:hypothetical protein OIV83_005527 [Microbotryomycetes sp. JL201]|nr:hypothetical protein OIV83_005527 [Microbotryomycetes sp. JL201]
MSSTSLPPKYRLSTSKKVASRHSHEISRVLLEDERVYWAKHRTHDIIQKQIESSWKFVTVLYCCDERLEGQERDALDDEVERDEQVAGFARVIADGETFGYLADVVIVKEHEGKGLARTIVTEAVDHSGSPSSSSLDWKWLLFTGFPSLYARVVKFEDPAPRGWAMLRWPTDPPRPIMARPVIPSSYSVSADKQVTLKHLPAITNALLSHPLVYWGKSRTRDVVKRQFERCEAVTVVHTDESGDETLVGFARIVTDMFDFGYIADVFVLPEHGKRGLAKALIQTAVEDLGGPGCSRNWKWTLFTDDAHSLYERFDFEKVVTGSRVMERFPRTGA